MSTSPHPSLCFWWSIFSLNYKNAYDHQTFQGGDMLQGALTHVYAWHQAQWSLSDHMTNKIHISTCRRCIHTTLGKVLTWYNRFPNMTLWSTIYISTFTRFIANKLDLLLTLGRIFSTQTLKSSSASCFKCNFLTFFYIFMKVVWS